MNIGFFSESHEYINALIIYVKSTNRMNNILQKKKKKSATCSLGA